jgi:hypothetical protein
MRIVCKILISLALLQGIAYAQVPEIQVVDGKVTMTAQSVPLGRVLSMLDRAMGLTSEIVKPELANRNISVRFTDLELKDAVRKIFEGQPLNYILIQGKGVRVTDLALSSGSTTSTSSPTTSAFSDPAPITPPAPIGAPIQAAPAAIVNTGGQPTPANTGGQPTPANAMFGNPQNPANAPNATVNPGATAPGQMPPPLGTTTPLTNNPLLNPVGGAQGGGAPSGGGPAVGGTPAGIGLPGAQSPAGIGLPGAQSPAPQPGPGTLGGATPGAIAAPGTIAR